MFLVDESWLELIAWGWDLMQGRLHTLLDGLLQYLVCTQLYPAVDVLLRPHPLA